ncbi:MAG TPA: sulfatase [Candidatus Binataceae bacterium]|nr:sulfatase [Candidatus Binataceae bacterium]
MWERENIAAATTPQSTGAARAGDDSSGRPAPRAQSEYRSGIAEYLFAGFVALAIVTVLTPLRALHALLPWRTIALLPLTVFQDLFLIAVFAWIFYGLFVVVKRPWARTTVAVAGWTVCLTLALYTYLSGIIYLIIRRPLTAGLIVAADNMKAIQASADSIVTPGLILALALAPVYTVLIALLLARLAPRRLKRMREGFHSATGLLLTVIYLAGARAWTVRHVPYALTSFNPQWTLVSSLFERHTPVIRDHIPAGYLEDFQPAGMRRSSSAAPLAVARFPLPAAHGFNVILFAMESVGARRVQLYGAPFDDTPNLDKLAHHAMVFRRVYVAEAETSAAFGAIFSSVYPDHDWPSITQLAPALAIPGLPAVLSSKGYRTAFIHSGQTAFDREGEFLATRGFDRIMAEPRDYATPRDQELLPEAIKWIKKDPSRPFFVTIWTHDTHHPYVSNLHHDYGVHDPSFNRYLNGVRATDDLVGQLAAALRTMGLADRTLLVVTGDHGEAFGEHGQLIHGGSVYNELMHVPLMIENPKLFPYGVVVDRLMRQIDLAPTLLALLGFNSPPTWQGTDVLGADPPPRAYLFAGTGNFTFGLVEGDFKYIYNFRRDRAQLYNLVKDPEEKNNIASNTAYAGMIKRDRLRLEAWISFQNRYLARFENPGAKAVH